MSWSGHKPLPMGGYVREVVGESRPTGAKKRSRRKTKENLAAKQDYAAWRFAQKAAGLMRKGSGHKF